MFAASGCKSARSERQMKQNVAAEINIFLMGMLSGVMTAAAFTYAFAIPANNYYWQSEIGKRGGAAWTFDVKSGHIDWKWMVEPKTDARRGKAVAAPAYKVNVRTGAAVDPEGIRSC